MEVPSPSFSQALESNGSFSQKDENFEEDQDISSVESLYPNSNVTAEIPHSNAHTKLSSNPKISSKSNNVGGKTIKKIKRVSRAASDSGSSSTSLQKGLHVVRKRRNPKLIIRGGGFCLGESDVDALALPLGMSIAAVVAQVLDRKNVADERILEDHLPLVLFLSPLSRPMDYGTICTSAVKESLVNVWGDRLDGFLGNFEQSFRSTLNTLRLINQASLNKGGDPLSHPSLENYCPEVAQSASPKDQGHAESKSDIESRSEEVPILYEPNILFSSVEEIHNMRSDSVKRELTLHGQINQQLAYVSPSTMGSGLNNSMLRTFMKSVTEQTRSNDLKEFEIGLKMKELKLKESQLALNSYSNCLERLKLSMGVSKASFRAEKFTNQLEDTRHAELLKKCMDCLVAGLLIMSFSLLYGAYVYSYERITEVTTSCMSLPKESNSWWIPKQLASFNSGVNLVRCQVRAVSRLLFGVFMILVIAYLLLQRPVAVKQTMPVTFILLLLGVVCGFAGKLCVDTLGGNGYSWLLYWEALCLLHFFANVCTSTLFSILHGPVSASQEVKAKGRLPYWVRRIVFYAMALFFIPLFCGLMPFAGPSDWKDHFFALAMDTLFGSTTVESN